MSNNQSDDARTSSSLLAIENLNFDHATVVAYYDHKPDRLRSLIGDLQSCAEAVLGSAFTSKEITSVHMTLLGLDQKIPGVRQDLVALLEYLWLAFRPGVVMQFGGFGDYTGDFRSRGRALLERSLTISRGQLVFMGWPVFHVAQGAAPCELLGQVRRHSEEYGFRHKYHDGDALDGDGYLVIGEVDRLNDRQQSHAIRRIRQKVLKQATSVALAGPSIQVVSYIETSLLRKTSTTINIADVLGGVGRLEPWRGYL